MDELRIAVVGVGHLGKHHARIYSQMPGVKLVGVVDTDKERAETVADRHDSRTFTSYAELPDELDAVSIAVPTTGHFELASYFLKRGVSVLVEKPMTATLEEAEELDRIAAATKDACLQVGHIERFNPAMVAIRDYKIEPKFIESHRLAPYKFRATDVGVVMDLMIHDIDIVMDLANSPPKRIDAVGGAILSESEDIANARIEFESGCVANITSSRVSFKSLRRTRVFSGDSFISLDYEKKYALLVQKSPDLDMSKVDLGSIDASDGEALKRLFMNDLLKMQELKLDEFEPLKKELESFAESVRNRTEPLVPSSHGLRAIRFANEVLESIRHHKW
ncbi:MAG: Gfo/Idh/MocA family oxidoreductase [Planctomycetota bacterium]|jgi:predicted dehydrogenase